MRRGRVAQLGERLVRNEEAEGSNPFSSTNYLAAIQRYSPTRLEALIRKTACVPVFPRFTFRLGGPASDSFTQHIQIRVRVTFGDGFRAVS